MKLSREFYSVLFAFVGVLIFFTPLKTLVVFSFESGLFSYIPLVFFISAYLIFLKRKEIRNLSAYCLGWGSVIVLVACCILIFALENKKFLSEYDELVLSALSFVLWSMGGFILFYGLKAFRAVSFPLFFLLFAVPIPEPMLDGIVSFLQVGSTELTDTLLKILRIPFSRDGFVFHLAGLNIKIAKQCSGIRSSLVLLMVTLLAGEFFLKTRTSKFLFVLAAVPIAVLKNSVRIVTLILIAAYVDKRILLGQLHTRGGILFFILALFVMAPIVLRLRKIESKASVE